MLDCGGQVLHVVVHQRRGVRSRICPRLEAAGATLLEKSRYQNAELGSRVAVVEDPDGTRIELIEMPGDPRAPLGRPVAEEA